MLLHFCIKRCFHDSTFDVVIFFIEKSTKIQIQGAFYPFSGIERQLCSVKLYKFTLYTDKEYIDTTWWDFCIVFDLLPLLENGYRRDQLFNHFSRDRAEPFGILSKRGSFLYPPLFIQNSRKQRMDRVWEGWNRGDLTQRPTHSQWRYASRKHYKVL